MTYISRSRDFSSFICFALKNILDLFAKRDSGELHCPATALIFCFIFAGYATYQDGSPGGGTDIPTAISASCGSHPQLIGEPENLNEPAHAKRVLIA